MELTETTLTELDPVSPELVLVDPELAKRARRELPPVRVAPRQVGAPAATGSRSEGARALRADAADAHAVPAVPTPAEGGRKPASDAEAVRLPEAHGPGRSREASSRRSWPRRIAFATGALFIGVAGFALASQFAGRGAGAKSVQSPGAADAPQPARDRSGKRATREGTPAGTGRSQATAPSERAGRHGAGSSRRKRTATGFATRVFVWPRVRRARYYKVEFFRRGKRLFVAWPSAPRLELPLRWVYKGRRMRLVAGVYGWRVSPAFGSRARPRYGSPINRSKWIARKRTHA